MSYGEVVTSERSFHGYRFFLQPYRGHKLFETVQTVQIVQIVQIVKIVQLILWYKSNTSYAEAQVLSIVNGQA